MFDILRVRNRWNHFPGTNVTGSPQSAYSKTRNKIIVLSDSRKAAHTATIGLCVLAAVHGPCRRRRRTDGRTTVHFRRSVAPPFVFRVFIEICRTRDSHRHRSITAGCYRLVRTRNRQVRETTRKRLTRVRVVRCPKTIVYRTSTRAGEIPVIR